MSLPTDAAAATTHVDPYSFYAGLAQARPFFRDGELGLWVATDAETVEAVLTSDLCRVRPEHEPVPAALVGTTAGKLFGRLVRMTDGPAHAPLKDAVSAALATVDADAVASLSADWARSLWEDDGAAPIPARVASLAFDLSPHVVGSLLGVPPANLATVAVWMGEFVRWLAPASGSQQIARGIAAAEDLVRLFTDLLHERSGYTSDRLLAALRREIERVGIADEAVVVANAVGLLSQAYEATAGLIGNALLALAADSEPYAITVADPHRMRRVVLETLHRDPPIQSTRRYVDLDGMIAGHAVRAGDVILVLLAAANHDPGLVIDRDGDVGCGYALGSGPHACPGGGIAVAIAAVAVRHIVAAGVDLAELAASFAYRPSANARIPLFGEREAPT